MGHMCDDGETIYYYSPQKARMTREGKEKTIKCH